MVMISVPLASPSKKIRGEPALSSPSLLLLLLLLLLLSLFLNPVSQIVVSGSKQDLPSFRLLECRCFWWKPRKDDEEEEEEEENNLLHKKETRTSVKGLHPMINYFYFFFIFSYGFQ
jgi:hypothetical protein